MQKKIFPIILIAALLVSSLVSLFFIHNLQGNAKVINYAGVVRGATQRLIKQDVYKRQVYTYAVYACLFVLVLTLLFNLVHAFFFVGKYRI